MHAPAFSTYKQRRAAFGRLAHAHALLEENQYRRECEINQTPNQWDTLLAVRQTIFYAPTAAPSSPCVNPLIKSKHRFVCFCAVRTAHKKRRLGDPFFFSTRRNRKLPSVSQPQVIKKYAGTLYCFKKLLWTCHIFSHRKLLNAKKKFKFKSKKLSSILIMLILNSI
jgi:hypothetical protein